MMMVLLSILIFFTIIILYLVLAPFFFEIDTVAGIYRIRFHYLASVNFELNDSLFIRVKCAGLSRRFDLLNPDSYPNVSGEKKIAGESAPPGKFPKISIQRMKQVMGSFQVKKCEVNIDTGVAEFNGLIYPLFQWLNRNTGAKFHINFLGENSLQIKIKNSFARMIWAYIRSTFKK